MEVWGWPLLRFAIVTTALLSYAFDAVRLDNYSINWLPINLISFGGAVIFIIIGVSAVKPLNLTENQLSAVNVSLAAIAMGSKNLATFYLCEVFGIADTGNYFMRFLGGVFIGVSLLVIYANLRGASIERQVIQRELLQKENDLIGFRENAPIFLAEEQEDLIRKTSGELLPRFLKLQSQVEIGEDVKKLRSRLEELLTKEVKPLSASLASEAKSLRNHLSTQSIQVVPEEKISLNLGSTIRPFASAFLYIFAIWMLSTVILPDATLFDILICTAIYFLSLSVIKLIFSKAKSATVNRALAVTVFPGYLSGILPFYLLLQIPHDPKQNSLFAVAMVIAGISSTFFSQAAIVDAVSERTEQRLKDLVARFSRENKLFEQKLWVAQHLWYTLLHGTVQSALTAAMIRSANKRHLASEDKAAILADLNRAISALSNPAREKVDFAAGLEAIKLTWNGLVEIETNVNSADMKTIQASQDSALVVNELIKEVVSNAVKHGSASQVRIDLAVTEDRDIALLVVNNGLKPTKKSEKGIGTVLFQTLCTDYSLSRNSATNETEFRATIPMA